MVLDKGVTAIKLLELRQETSGNVPRALESPEGCLDGFLPGLEVLTIRRRLDHASLTEPLVAIDKVNNVHRFGHDKLILRKLLDSIIS